MCKLYYKFLLCLSLKSCGEVITYESGFCFSISRNVLLCCFFTYMSLVCVCVVVVVLLCGVLD
jgi:hypothetical protein